MKLELQNGCLCINVNELLEHLTHEQIIEIANNIACMDTVITEVANQIIEGWTTDGSRGGKGCTPEKPHTALDRAIDRMARESGHIADDRIGGLVRRCETLATQVNEWQNRYNAADRANDELKGRLSKCLEHTTELNEGVTHYKAMLLSQQEKINQLEEDTIAKDETIEKLRQYGRETKAMFDAGVKQQQIL